MESRDQYEERRSFERSLFALNTVKTGVACNTCQTELVDAQPGLRIATMPARMHVECPGCGWKGTMTV